MIVILIFSTALETPLPPNLSLFPSLSSNASNSPVEAPLGAAPRPTVPPAKYTSASTVGFPLESIISLPTTFSISKCNIFNVNPFPWTSFVPAQWDE